MPGLDGLETLQQIKGRKPDSAVAAAIASDRSARPLRRGAAPHTLVRPQIETLTLNGFQILASPEAARPASAEHAFRVRHVADGVEFAVTVAIDPEAVDRVARLTHRRLEPGGAFWRSQAERLLSAFVWSEGKGPAEGRLTVRDVSREDLDVVARWEFD